MSILNINKKEEIYNNYLQEIANITLTLREIDVISCIITNRGEKKIASILAISYRTVSTHIRNIMTKFGYNSREQIIDIIEKSGKLSYLKQYYAVLITESAFKQHLKKIASLVNREGITYYINTTRAKEKKSFVNQLINLLNIANIKLLENESDDNQLIYSISKTSGSKGVKVDENIMLLIDDNDDQEFFKDTKYVDFTKDANGYFDILALIEKLITKGEINKLTQESKDEYVALQASFNDKAVNKLRVKRNNFWQRFLLTTLALGMIITGIGVIYQFNNSLNKNAAIETELDKLIKISENVLSADSIIKGNLQKNYVVVKQFEIMNELFSNADIAEYFKHNVQSENLLQYLFILHSVAAFYNYNEYNGLKARKILLHAKSLAENYVNDLSVININFDNLEPDEILSELSVVKDLPEMYTRIIYLLGRTYIYQGDINNGKSYFELAKYLGNELDLFEGYLAITSGIQIIQTHYINVDIENSDYKQVTQILEAAIKSFEMLQYDIRQYKINYDPGKANQQIIIPKEDFYNRVYISNNIIKFYAVLIAITNDSYQKKDYTKRVLLELTKSKILSEFTQQSNALIRKKIADIYNSLGNILLGLHDTNINSIQLKNYVVKELAIKEKIDLDIIYQIFELAKLKSRASDYTKIDSYNGIIKVCKRKMQQKMINKKEKDMLKQKIQNFKNKIFTIQKILRGNYEE